MDLTLDFEKIWQEYGMDELENSICSLFPEYRIDMDEVFYKILSGNIFGAMKDVFGGLLTGISNELASQKNTFLWLLVFGIGAVLISNFIKVFDEHEVADIGFYFSYLCISAILFRCFGSTVDTAGRALENIVSFIRAFVPAYFLSVGLSAGSITAKCGYEVVVFTIYLVEHILFLLILPLIKIYVLLVLVSGLWSEERLNLMISGLEKIIRFLQKACFSVVAGLSAMQSMITPSLDAAKSGVLKKAISAVPGVGDVADGVVDVVLASSVVIKNSIGFLLLLFLILVTVLPMVKILFTGLLIRTAAAILSIVSDKRIIRCTDNVGNGSNLLFRTVGLSSLMFMITVSVAAFTTNRGF